MGLSMYFYARRYTSMHYPKRKEKPIAYPKELIKFRNIYSHKTEWFEIGYFRKFNALHSWIVQHCAEGIDECQPICISKSQVEELLETLKQVKEDHSKASELLPTQEGFFFGGTSYGEWYFQNIDDAIELFENFLELTQKKEYDIVYQASW